MTETAAPVVFAVQARDAYDQVAENLKRQNFSPIELAQFILRRVDAGESNAEVGRQLGMELSTVAHHLALHKEQGITCNMSRAGEVWDNSAMESFFSSMKTERSARKVYRTRAQARADVFDDIERFDNPTRLHSTLG
jgi:transposase InsO family protein